MSKNMILVTPSQWLADLIAESYMKEYRTKLFIMVLIRVFLSQQKVMLRRNIIVRTKKIVLGVAAVWDETERLKYFY